MKQQKGFGLLELMVVVAIIAILAAFAIPTYFDYIKKAKAAEATVLFSDFRLKTLIYYSERGIWPPDMMTLEMIGVVTKGTFAWMQTYDSLGPSVCYTVVGFDPGKDSIGWKYVPSPSDPMQKIWSCKMAESGCTTIENKYLPQSCI